MICVISAGVCLAPRVSGGRRQWQLQVGQLLGQQRCNSRGSLEEREDSMEAGGRRRACSPIRRTFPGRKGLRALSKGLWGTRLFRQGQAAWRKRVRLGLGDEKTWTRRDWVSTWSRAGSSLPPVTRRQGQREGLSPHWLLPPLGNFT